MERKSKWHFPSHQGKKILIFFSTNPFAWQEKPLPSPKRSRGTEQGAPAQEWHLGPALPPHVRALPENWVVLILHLRTPSVHYPPGCFFPLCNLFVSRAADREVKAPYKHVRSRFLPGWRAKQRRCNLSRSHPEFWVGRAPHAPCETLRVLLPPRQGEKLQNQQIRCLSISEMLLSTSPRSCLSPVVFRLSFFIQMRFGSLVPLVLAKERQNSICCSNAQSLMEISQGHQALTNDSQ